MGDLSSPLIVFHDLEAQVRVLINRNLRNSTEESESLIKLISSHFPFESKWALPTIRCVKNIPSNN